MIVENIAWFLGIVRVTEGDLFIFAFSRITQNIGFCSGETPLEFSVTERGRVVIVGILRQPQYQKQPRL